MTLRRIEVLTKMQSATILTAVFLLTACASGQVRLREREALLAKSGFAMKPADTARRQAILAHLPAEQFTERTKNGKNLFLYADPKFCNCLFVGDEAAYDQYQSALIERQSARDDPGVEGSRHESIENYKADSRAAGDVKIEDWGAEEGGPL